MSSLIIAFPRMEDARRIRGILLRREFEVSALCISGAQVLHAATEQDCGIVLCGYRLPDMFFRELCDQLPEGYRMILVASARVISAYEDVEVAKLSMPFAPVDLYRAVAMLQRTLPQVRRKKSVRPPARPPEEQRVIDEAKAALMRRNQMTESEAHKYLQKTSMDNGRTLIETAGMVLALLKKQ